MQDRSATVFDVQRFSVHDGPGIRTVVFFKGCSLECVWCQNPEAIRAAPEILYDASRCLDACERCVPLCGSGALRSGRMGRVDFARCTACGDCARECPSEALRIVGRSWTASELLGELLRDRPFYEASGGGVTFSGGEPVLHAPFLEGFLPRLAGEGLRIAVETCGAYPFDLVEPLLESIDLVLFDVKVADAERHRALTGRSNQQILENLRRLLGREMRVEVRMPVVPGHNDGDECVEQMAALLHGMGVGRLTLLPYNHLWEAKLPRLGGGRRPLGVRPPPDGHYETLSKSFEGHGISASI